MAKRNQNFPIPAQSGASAKNATQREDAAVKTIADATQTLNLLRKQMMAMRKRLPKLAWAKYEIAFKKLSSFSDELGKVRYLTKAHFEKANPKGGRGAYARKKRLRALDPLKVVDIEI